MSKQSTLSSALKQMHLTDNLTENRLIEWLLDNKRTILIGFIALFALIILSYRFMSARTLKAESDFFHAQTAFSHFQEKSTKPDEKSASLEDLNQLEAIISRHPELHAKYDGLIAQTLIIEQDATQARPFAQSAFERTKIDSLNFYQDYAENSLLITSGNFQEAVLKAQQLKEKMDADLTNSLSETLYLFNLTRLAALYQQLSQFKEERQAWEELQPYMNSEAFAAISQLFSTGNASFNQYIEERKKVLSP